MQKADWRRKSFSKNNSSSQKARLGEESVLCDHLWTCNIELTSRLLAVCVCVCPYVTVVTVGDFRKVEEGLSLNKSPASTERYESVNA